MRLRRVPLFCLATFLLLSAGAAGAATHNVTVGPGLNFTPTTLNIRAGDTVTWTNAGGFHDVVADDGSFNSGAPSSSNWVFSHTFTTPGSFGYFCSVHFGMRGGINVAGEPSPCVEGPATLCLNNGRFKVEVSWRIPNGSEGVGQAVPLPSAPDSGLFYFFNATNIEMLVKVLNGCSINNRFWVFYAATTNVQFTLRVTDSQTGVVKTYTNPLNQPATPIQDTGAFATCS